MQYKVIFHIGNDINLKTKVDSGILMLQEDSLSISGSTNLTIPYTTVTRVEMFRLYGLGRMIKVICSDRTIFISVFRLNLSGYFVFINFFKTGHLYDEIIKRIPMVAAT